MKKTRRERSGRGDRKRRYSTDEFLREAETTEKGGKKREGEGIGGGGDGGTTGLLGETRGGAQEKNKCGRRGDEDEVDVRDTCSVQ